MRIRTRRATTNIALMVGSAAIVVALAFALGVLLGRDGESSRRGPAILSCLEGQFGTAVTTSEADLDVVAAGAGELGIAVEFARNSVDVAVERSEADARRTLRAYGLFLTDPGRGQLERVGSAVVAFDKTPTSDEHDRVRACVAG